MCSQTAVPCSIDDHPGWLELVIQIDPAAHDPLSAYLFDLGCTGIVSESSEAAVLKAYLPFQGNPEDLKNRLFLFLRDLKEIFSETPPPKLTINKIANQEWSRNWRRFFQPVRVSSQLLILPAWEPVPVGISGHIIRIDPGPAFGTGQHATTRMCLAAMEQHALKSPWTMLDVGTGSGILAIYGIKLGAESVVAIDLDPEALRWADHNSKINAVMESILISSEPIQHLRPDFSLVCANLTRNEIINLSSHFTRLLCSGGCLIISGILKDQVDEVAEVLRQEPFRLHRTLCSEEWACMTWLRA